MRVTPDGELPQTQDSTTGGRGGGQDHAWPAFFLLPAGFERLRLAWPASGALTGGIEQLNPMNHRDLGAALQVC